MRLLAVVRRSASSYVLPVLLGLATFGYVQDHMAWRFEYARAVDRCGLYIFLAGPVIAGVAAFDSWQHKRRFQAIAGSLPRPWLLRIRPCTDAVTLAWMVHVVVLVTYLATAAASHAVGGVPVAPVVLQLCSLAGYAALGALTGWLARSPVAAPLLAGGIILLNVEGAITGDRFRRITTVGTGTTDLIGRTTDPGHLVRQLLVFGALVACVVVARRAGYLAVRVTGVVAGLLAVGSALSLYAGNGDRLVFDRSALPYACGAGGVRVCGPSELRSTYPSLARSVTSVAAPLRDAGVDAIPREFDVDIPSAPLPARGVGLLTVTSSEVRRPAVVRQAAVLALTQPATCDDPDPLAPPPPASVLAIRAMVTGWLAHRTGTPLDGRYPGDLVAALEHLPPAQQQAWLRRTYADMWACRDASLRLPDGVAAPSWFDQ